MSGLLPEPRHALLVAKVELLRQWRRTASGGVAQLLALGFVVLLLFGGSVVVGFGGYLAGGALREGAVADPVAAGQFVVAGVVVFVAAIVAFRAITESGRVDQADGMLTTVPHRDLVGGVVLSEAAVTALLFGLPALAGAVGLAFGAGSAVAGLLVLVALLAAGAVAVAAGWAAGMALRNVLARSEVVARHRIALGALAFLVYMVLVVTNTLGQAIQPVVAAFRRTPVAWFADLGLLALADGASPLQGAAALVAAPVVVGVALAVSVRLAGLLWYADPVDAGVGDSTSRLSAGFSSGPAGRLLPRPTAAVMVKCWLRARRAPIQLVFVAYPLFLLVAPVTEAVQTGTVPASLPATIALYGAWATGAAFALNPLGDEGAVLPATLISGVSGRQFVGGEMLAGAVVGAPATALAAFVAGVLGPQSVAAAAGLAAVSAALAVAATGIAAGVGVAFPRFDAVRISRSRKAVIPSMLGFGVYSLVVLVAAVPALVTQVPFAAAPLADAVGTGTATLAVAGSVLAVALAGGAGLLGARYAIHRFDSYHE